MISRRLLRKYINGWLSWRAERRLSRAIPSLAANRIRLHKLQQSHKNTRPVLDEMRAAMNRALRGEANG